MRKINCVLPFFFDTYSRILRNTLIKFDVFLREREREREGTMGCLLHKYPKFYNNVFIFVGLTTLGTLVNFNLLIH